jgi:hypothetical protein
MTNPMEPAKAQTDFPATLRLVATDPVAWAVNPSLPDFLYQAAVRLEALAAQLAERDAEIERLKGAVRLERDRACGLLEAAYEAADWLGPGDNVADEKLVPAILKADGDPEYAKQWAEERGFFSPDAIQPGNSHER